MYRATATALMFLTCFSLAQVPLPHSPLECHAPATRIHEVQGSLPASPLTGRLVTVEGVVVGDFQRDNDPFGTNLGGFMVQEEDAHADDDPATSEGIYVYAYEWEQDVQLGDLVRATGTVAEYHGLTELVDVTHLVVCASGVPLPSAAVVEFPLQDVADLEAFEGMLVTFPQDLVISEFFNYDRFGEIVLTLPPGDADRWHQPTSLFGPDDAAADEYLDLLARSRIILDDGIGTQNPDVVRHPDGGLFSATHTFRGGDILRNLTGVLDYGFGAYRVQPVLGAEYVRANPRPLSPEAVGGTVRVASFNVLNYFVTLGARGADDNGEFTRQRAKIIAALLAMDVHAVGLVEIQNDHDQAALRDLVAGLNQATAPGTWDHVRSGGPVGTDQITVAVIYRPDVLLPAGLPAVLDEPGFVDPLASGHQRNRPALAVTFDSRDGAARFTLVVTHLKSKGSSCDEPFEDGLTGSCNLTRVQAATALHDWLATDPTGSGDADFLLVGDVNAYGMEGPAHVLRSGPDGLPGTADDYTDLLQAFIGPQAYTYLFDGQLGYLDHALASPSLLPQVTGVTVWHINADEPDVLDYDTGFKSAAQVALYRPDPFRSSDHDPVIIGLELQP